MDYAKLITTFTDAVASTVEKAADYAEKNKLSYSESCHVAAHGILQLLDGEMAGHPGFMLTVIPGEVSPKPSRAYLPGNRSLSYEGQQEIYDEERQRNANKWPRDGVEGQAVNPPNTSLSKAYHSSYEDVRDMLQINAASLFT